MEHFSTIIYEKFLSNPLPQDFVFCAKSTYYWQNYKVYFFGINYIFQIKYFVKKIKQDVQLMRAVA